MFRKTLVSSLLAIALCVDGACADTLYDGIELVSNGGFESPTVSAFEYRPSLSDWVYGSSLAGVSDGTDPGHGGFCTTGQIPEGRQYAFLQRTGSFISQTIDFPTSGEYSLSYYAGGRLGSWAAWPYGPYGGDTTYDVLLDSTVIATGVTKTDSEMELHAASFLATSGTHELEFLITGVSTSNVPTTDQSALFDAISITPIPEPGVLFLSIGGVVLFAWRRRRSHRRFP